MLYIFNQRFTKLSNSKCGVQLASVNTNNQIYDQLLNTVNHIQAQLICNALYNIMCPFSIDIQLLYMTCLQYPNLWTVLRDEIAEVVQPLHNS